MSRTSLGGVLTAAVVGILVGGGIGLYVRSVGGPVGMGGGTGSTGLVAIGSPEGGGGWITLYRGLDERPVARTRVPWKAYNDAVGSARPVPLRLNGGATQQIVVALDPMGSEAGGRFVVLDGLERGCRTLAWRQVILGEAEGPQTLWISGGDIDGDGRDEIAVGSPEAKGYVLVLDDLAHDLAPLCSLRIPWGQYDKECGETRPAVGDLDGDGKAEVVVGLGRYRDKGGWLAVFKEERFSQWVRFPWSENNANGGGTWPAVGDLRGTGKGQLVVGADCGRWAALALVSDPLGEPEVEWIPIPDEVQQEAIELRPICAQLDGTRLSQVVAHLPQTPSASAAALFDDKANDCGFLGWRVGFTPESGPVAGANEASEKALAALRVRCGELTVLRGRDQRVNFLAGNLCPAAPGPSVERAKQFLSENLAIWGLSDLARDLSIDEKRSCLTIEGEGTAMVAYRQVVSGVPVRRGELHVHVSPNGVVRSVTGDVEPSLVGFTMDTRPGISAEKAVEYASLHAAKHIDASSQPELLVWKGPDRTHIVWQTLLTSVEGGFGREHLVDAVDGRVLQVEDRTMADQHVEEEVVCTGTTPRNVPVRALGFRVHDEYEAQGTSEEYVKLTNFTHNRILGAGIVTTRHSYFYATQMRGGWFYKHYLFQQGAGATVSRDFSESREERDAIAAHYNIGRVLQYWKASHKRRGWDGGGGEVNLIVYEDNAGYEGNAEWVHLENRQEDTSYWFGNGWIKFGSPEYGDDMSSWTTFDICSHEFAHGVVESTCPISADLSDARSMQYARSTMAIHEHLADAFAMFSERKLKSETRQPAEHWWLIGEEAATGPHLGHFPRPAGTVPPRALRWMAWPNALDAADHMTESVRIPDGRDFGAHERSNILSKFLFLWVVGGSHPDPMSRWASVQGMARAFGNWNSAYMVAERAYYNMLLRKRLDPYSDFDRFRAALLETIANDLDPWSLELRGKAYRQAVEAFRAVGIGW